jgi:O-antigen/teichoic acid export membrane protein
MPQENKESFDKLSKVIVKTGVFILSLSILGKGAGYLFNMLLTKSVSTEIYGIFSLAWGVVTFSATILLLGIPNAISRFVAFYRGKADKNKVNNSIITGGFLIVILTFLSFFIFFILYKFFPDFLSLKRNEFILVCILFLLRSSEGFFNSIISGFRKPHITKLIRFLLEILRPTFLLLLIAIGISLSIFNVVFVLILSVLLPTFFAGFYSIKKFGLRGKFKFKLARKLLKFGMPITVTSTASNLLGWADMFMIRIFLGFSALGIYYIANLTAAVELIFFSAFLAIFTPIITEHFGRKDFEGASKLSSYLLESFFLLFIPIFIAFFAFPREILVILFTGDYAKGALAFQMMSLSMFLYGTSNLFTTILNSSGKPEKVAKIVGISAGINVIANFFLIPILGIEGAAIATVCSSSLLLLLSYLEVGHIIKLKISFSRIGKILLAAFVSLPFTFMVKKLVYDSLLALISSSCVLIIVYLTLLLLLKTFRMEDITIIKAILKKLNIPKKIKDGIIHLFLKGTF